MAQFLGHRIPWLAAGLAVGISIFVMERTNSLHPPGGAAALTAVIGSDDIHRQGYFYVLVPCLVGFSSSSLLLLLPLLLLLLLLLLLPIMTASGRLPLPLLSIMTASGGYHLHYHYHRHPCCRQNFLTISGHHLSGFFVALHHSGWGC